MNLGWSGFTPAGYPKVVPIAVAEHVEKNNLQGKWKFNLFIGASVGAETEDRWAVNDMIDRRWPYQTGKNIAAGINEGRIRMGDKHLSLFAQDLGYGFYTKDSESGKLDLAIIEVSAITEDGGLVPTTSCGVIPEILMVCDKIIVEVNTGGGLGTQLQEGDEPLDLDAWAAILARHLGPLGVVVGTEPGEFFTKDAGVLLAEVVSVEERLGTTFVGLAAGWNVVPLRFVWGEFVELVHCTAADASRTQRVTVSGHINEAPDLFAEDYPLPPTQEGDVLAILGVGGYCQAVATPHCLRPTATAIFFDDRAP
jgi:hypothetical protein